MLRQEQITELCICNRQDLIDKIQSYGSKLSKGNSYSVHRATHGIPSSLSDQDFIDYGIQITYIDKDGSIVKVPPKKQS